MTLKTYSHNEQIKETISQRAIRSSNYSRHPNEHLRRKYPDERSPEFSRGSYLDDRRSFQRSFDMNNYFSQTTEYNRFKIKRQDIDIFDLQFPNLKSQRTITDGFKLIFTDIYDFIKYI